MIRYVQIAYSLYALGLYLILMIMLAPGFLLVLVLPKSSKANFILLLCKLWSFMWMGLVGILYRIERFEQNVPMGPTIFIANHRSYLDVVTLVRLIDRPTRILGRHDICEVPIIGYFYKQAVIPVDRRSEAGRGESMVNISRIINLGLSVFIFPEGTFNESDQPLSVFRNGAFKLAIRTGTPIQPVIFLDNHKRMSPRGSLNFSPGLSRVVLLEQININDHASKDVNELKDYVWNQMHTEIRKHKVSYFEKGMDAQ